jgi:Excreted virulence factor EspC, type VII ESX diderm
VEPGFNVDLNELRGHAKTVSDVAEQVRSEAGSQDSVGGAFGQIAEFFASAVDAAATDLRGVIGHAGDSVDEVRVGLGKTADGYQSTDEHFGTVFGGGGSSGGGGGQRFAQDSGGPTDVPGGLTVTLPDGTQFHTEPGNQYVVPEGSTAVDRDGRTVIDGRTNPRGGRLEGDGLIRVVPPTDLPGS